MFGVDGFGVEYFGTIAASDEDTDGVFVIAVFDDFYDFVFWQTNGFGEIGFDELIIGI